MRKIGFCLVVALVAAGMLMLMSGTALANWGPHGGYGEWLDTNTDGVMQASELDPDTDACAGCHRAHTAVSPVTWTDNDGGVKNALLIGSTATTLRAFCYTCHGSLGRGAATDVQAGMYDNSAARVNASFDNIAGYGTVQSEYLAPLNGGGFEEVNGNTTTSSHLVDGTAGVAWGETANGTGNGGTNIVMDCASCHDPHGSSNYRILKDKVNGIDVGGYIGGVDAGIDPVPNPWVIANEIGYPTAGFRLHRNYGDLDNDGTTESGDYQPDYTEARYAMPVGLNTAKGMSGWCAACHSLYNTVSSSGQGAYNVNDGYGNVVRHRHPVNQPLDTFAGDRSLILGNTAVSGQTGRLNDPFWDGTLGTVVDIPLDHDVATEGRGNAALNQLTDYIECLTCHRAHGTDATMEGYANVSSNVNPQPNSGTGGVPPTGDSVLLRANNRGVCERCHNK